jgi:hypothetical protein
LNLRSLHEEFGALLGAKAFDPKNPQPDAFGCAACHTSKGQ